MKTLSISLSKWWKNPAAFKKHLEKNSSSEWFDLNKCCSSCVCFSSKKTDGSSFSPEKNYASQQKNKRRILKKWVHLPQFSGWKTTTQICVAVCPPFVGKLQSHTSRRVDVQRLGRYFCCTVPWYNQIKAGEFPDTTRGVNVTGGLARNFDPFD